MTLIKKILLTTYLVFLTSASFALETDNTNISPKEIYGDPMAEIKIKISNRTAGQTGLLRALAEDFLKSHHKKYAIAWYNHSSTNSFDFLKRGLVDMALTYQSDMVDIADDEGWTSHRTLIFHDHFLVAGPKSNPASLENTDPLNLVFKKIYYRGKSEEAPIFLSRNVDSATNSRERLLWSAVNLAPWEQPNSWYVKLEGTQRESLLRADADNLYILTDRGTFLSNKSKLSNLKVYISSGKVLSSPCFAVLGEESTKESIVFLEYLRSDRAQNLISEFGKDKFGGHALFTPANQAEF